MRPFSADALRAMLAKRHADDVFVPECKDGPTQTRAHRRLDAWVLLKTWSPITTIGYEIKVDRADWRRDEKLHDYMPLCHLLYIVAPLEVVPMVEIPAGVGLMVPVGESGRLQVKRKAARREIALPAELMVYVLMCRTKITRDRETFEAEPHWRTKQLRDWVEGKEERRHLSYAVSAKIRQVFEQQESELSAERQRNDDLARVRDRIAELGFDVTKSVHHWEVRSKLDRLNATIDDHTLHRIRNEARVLERLADDLEAIKAFKVDNSEEPVGEIELSDDQATAALQKVFNAKLAATGGTK
jgi:hypothetical protein